MGQYKTRAHFRGKPLFTEQKGSSEMRNENSILVRLRLVCGGMFGVSGRMLAWHWQECSREEKEKHKIEGFVLKPLILHLIF